MGDETHIGLAMALSGAGALPALTGIQFLWWGSPTLMRAGAMALAAGLALQGAAIAAVEFGRRRSLHPPPAG